MPSVRTHEIGKRLTHTWSGALLHRGLSYKTDSWYWHCPRLYALAGISEDNQDFVIDYSTSVTDVYISWARRRIIRTESLDVFSACTDSGSEDHPSWVPNLQMPWGVDRALSCQAHNLNIARQDPKYIAGMQRLALDGLGVAIGIIINFIPKAPIWTKFPPLDWWVISLKDLMIRRISGSRYSTLSRNGRECAIGRQNFTWHQRISQESGLYQDSVKLKRPSQMQFFAGLWNGVMENIQLPSISAIKFGVGICQYPGLLLATAQNGWIRLNSWRGMIKYYFRWFMAAKCLWPGKASSEWSAQTVTLKLEMK